MKRILVPCDFSAPAINAYRLALDIAQQSKGTIHLLNIIELPLLRDVVLMPVLNFEDQLMQELTEKAERHFNKIVGKYKNEVVTTLFNVEVGAVSHVIQRYIERESIDLVVMGSHGATGAREILVGSNAERVVRNSTVPVLIVKDYHKAAIRRIVFPNSLETEDQENLVMKVKALQNFFRAHLHLVWINTPLNFAPDTITKQRLDAFARRFMLKDYTINVFNDTDEERGIIAFTNSVKGDLIAIGTHGRKWVSHLISGSLAEDIVNHNKGLVWTYSMKHVPEEA